jgi:hypothetical protein
MQRLDIQDRLEYARAAVAVIRALGILEKTMRYSEFATAIGLKADGEKWEPWHRQQVSDILYLLAATQRQAGSNTGTDPLKFEWIVTGDGEPGEGFYRNARIVID